MRNVVFSLLLALAAQSVVAQPKDMHRPFITSEPFVHDPVVAYEDSTYHLFCTGRGIQHMTSRDRKEWRIGSSPLMTVMPAWTQDSVPGFEDNVWAPDIIRYNDKWYMAYSCSTFGKNGSAIGLLSSRSLSPHEIWKDEGCVVCSHEQQDNWNAIDPNFIIDGEGTPWMTYGSFWDGIQLVRLDTTFHVAAGEKPFTIARRHGPDDTDIEPNPTSEYAGDNAIEAPFLFFHDGYYYLFVAWDYCCRGEKSNYRVAVGRSKDVKGPYLDAQGKPMLIGGGTLVIEGDKAEYDAAGHCSVYSFPDGDYFFCHGYSVKHKGAPILIQREIDWTTGWPVLK